MLFFERKPGAKEPWTKPLWIYDWWRVFSYEELVARDKLSLDIFWLKDESLEDSSKLPDPHVLAAEIADDLRSALGQIESVLGDLQKRAVIVSRKPTRFE